jgi:hypothetical protein
LSGKQFCRTVVALVGLDSHSTAQLGPLLLSLYRTAWDFMAEMEATMTWKARSRGSLLTAAVRGRLGRT